MISFAFLLLFPVTSVIASWISLAVDLAVKFRASVGEERNSADRFETTSDILSVLFTVRRVGDAFSARHCVTALVSRFCGRKILNDDGCLTGAGLTVGQQRIY